MKKAIIESLKEAGRLAFFAALTALVGWATQQLTNLDPSTTYYIVGTALLRIVDRFIHTNEDIKATGISPF